MGERHSRAGHQDGVNVPARPGHASYGPLALGPAGWDVGGGARRFEGGLPRMRGFE